MRNQTPNSSVRGRKLWFGALAGFTLLAVICGTLVLTAGTWLTPIAKREMLAALKRQYRSEVEIGSLDISFSPHPHAKGTGLVFRAVDQVGGPPLITLRGFDADTSWLGLLLAPHRIGKVRLDGLEIHIVRGGPPHERGGPGSAKAAAPDLIFEQVVADGTVLQILPRDTGKQPLIFDIYRLSLTSGGAGLPMHYRAQLHNARPPGTIDANGDFGPWNAADPGETGVTGKYRFAKADLSVFRGISGQLSSDGEFHGKLDRIEVNGETDTPDFEVSVGGHRMRLRTTFSATVDGTNGDTLLHPVNARFGRTTVVAQGGIIGQPGVRGKTVMLDATLQDGDVADVLRLGVKSEPPPMKGRIRFQARIRIPPGPADIPDRLELKGQFAIAGGRFTNADLERKLSTVSERTQGKTDGNGESAALSDFSGTFTLRGGLVTLAGFSFRIPGATVRLDGTYGLKSEALDFRGSVATEVRLSQMTTGVKSVLLRAVDPLFSRNRKGAVIPIHIGGTRSNPSFGLRLGR
ncbi:MAG: AsmA-like C-terminal region-containing protein [Bryobacteraceae bacterium]